MEQNSSDQLFKNKVIELIKRSPIFSGIDQEACENLVSRLNKIMIKEGKVLFKQGDPSDSLYILIDGQLIAVLGLGEGTQKVLGTIEEGETVGEMGVISNQPRSLGIQAIVDSVLVKLPKKEFLEFSKEHPEFISKIVDLVISRSQNTIKLITQKKIYEHIAIIKGDDDQESFDHFIKKLKDNYNEDAKFIFIDKANNSSLPEIIERKEHENYSVIFILDKDNINLLKVKLNHIGGIYVVVNGDRFSHLNDFAVKMLSRQQTPFTSGYELILLHDDRILNPTNTMHWLRQDTFTLHHHLKLNDDEGYQRILRFMKGTAIGLVLGGGGFKGWAFLGMLKALLELQIPIDAIGGTSVGSIISGYYATHLKFDQTWNEYNNLIDYLRSPFSFINLTWPVISIISGKKPTEGLQNSFKNIQIEDLWIPYFSISVNLSTGKEVLQKTGNLWEKTRASCSIPGVSPPLVLDGELYYDGGLLNNLPVDQMRNIIGENSIIIAGSLTAKGEKIEKYNMPHYIPFRLGFLRKLGLGYKEYNFPPFLNTFIEALLIGSSTKETINKKDATILIAPDLSQFKTLSPNRNKINEMVNIGYETTYNEIVNSSIFGKFLKSK